jgi:uncharacterized protein
MKWSKYNLLFKSERHGHLLYNSLTNSFARIDDLLLGDIEAIKESPESYDFSKSPGLYLQLLSSKVLVKEHEEGDFLNILRMERLANSFDTADLTLTIVPTYACNFNCTYCYEAFRRPVHMNEEMENHLIRFIKRFSSTRGLRLTWYGGEPILRFETICRITEKIRAIGLPYGSSLVTNGYLLDETIIRSLDELQINSLQITIDGSEEVHNSRRSLATGGKTYGRIMTNIEKLLAHWDGSLNIRVNVDRENTEEFYKLDRYFSEKFNGKNIYLYPGIVKSFFGRPMECELTRNQICEFRIDAYRKHGITKLSYYPERKFGCGATSINSYVIGPLGEIYKCWLDIGLEDMVIGKIYEDRFSNERLLANYLIGTSVFDDPRCRECSYLPLCDGGCANLRMKNRLLGASFDICVAYKDRLPELLEIYYEMKSAKKED